MPHFTGGAKLDKPHVKAALIIVIFILADHVLLERTLMQGVDDALKVIFSLWAIDVVATFIK